MIKYGIYDSRYFTDPDSAMLFEVCDTLKEARRNAPFYGDVCAIVKMEIKNNVIVNETIIQ